MVRVNTLCGECIAKYRMAFKVTEASGRRKILCDSCKRRRYGAQCKIEKPNISANNKIRQ